MEKYHDEDNNAESLDSSGYESKTMNLGNSDENTSSYPQQNNEEKILENRDYDESKNDTERRFEGGSSQRSKTADGTQTEKSYMAENKREEDVSGLPIQHQSKSTRSNSPSSTYYYDAYNSLASTGKSSSKRRTRNDSRDAESIEEKIRKIEEEIERLQNRVNQNSKKSKDDEEEYDESGNVSKSSTATPGGRKRNTKSASKFPPINKQQQQQEEEEKEVDMTEYIEQAKEMTLPEIKRYYLHYENQLFRKGYDLPDFMPFCPPLHSKYSKEVLKAQADRHNEKRIEVLAKALKDYPLPSSCASSKRTSKASSIAKRQSIRSNLSATVPVESSSNNNNYDSRNDSEREYNQPGGGSGDEEEEEEEEDNEENNNNEEEERREDNNNNNKSQVSTARNSTRSNNTNTNNESNTNKYMSEDNQTLIQQRIAHNMKEASHRKYVLTHEIESTKKRLADYEQSQRELEQRQKEREKEEEKKRQEHQRELDEKEAHRIFNLQRARKLEEARLNRLKAKLHYQELKVERDKLLAAQQMQQHIEWVKEQNKLRKDRYDEAERLRKQRIKDYENYQKMQTDRSNALLKARNDSWAERKRNNDLAQMERDHKVLMAERRRLGRQMGYEEKYLQMKRRLEKQEEENEIMMEQSKDMRRADLMAKYQLEADIKRFLKPSPGPCSYNPKSFVEEWIPGSKINAPTTKENEELLMHLKGRSPGPLDYADFGYHSSTPVYSIGNAAPTHHGDEVPGPNTYDVGRTYKPDSPYFSVPRSIPVTDSDLMLYQAANSPSPVEYAPPIKEISSMRRTGFDSSKFNVPPKKRNVLFKTSGF